MLKARVSKKHATLRCQCNKRARYFIISSIIIKRLLIIEPELNKLKNKACGRVRNFLLEKIGMLKKPMTNI
jgi:hypothetical protein